MKIKKMFVNAVSVVLTVSALSANAFAADNLLGGDANLGKGWGGEYIDVGKFADIAEGDIVTVEYTINNEDSYHLVQIASGADGWPKLECTTKAVNNQEDADFRNQDDGFAVISVDGSVSYTLTASDCSALKNYGMVVRGYDITINSVTVDAPAAEDADTSEQTSEPVTESADIESTVNDNNSTDIAASESAASATGSTSNDKGNADTGVESIAAVAGLAAVAALGIVVAKKR